MVEATKVDGKSGRSSSYRIGNREFGYHIETRDVDRGHDRDRAIRTNPTEPNLGTGESIDRTSNLQPGEPYRTTNPGNPETGAPRAFSHEIIPRVAPRVLQGS